MKNKSWGGFRKPIKKGEIKTKKTGNMSLYIEGEDKEEKQLFVRYYMSLNREQKRNLIRRQEVQRRARRKEGLKEGKFGNHEHPVVKAYNKKLLGQIDSVYAFTYLEAVHNYNEKLRTEAEKRRNAVQN